MPEFDLRNWSYRHCSGGRKFLCFCHIFSDREDAAGLWVRAIWPVNFWDVITQRRTYSKWQEWSAGACTLSRTLISQPPWFYPRCERSSSLTPVSSHVFCCADVVTWEHPRVGKHVYKRVWLLLLIMSVLGISLPSLVALLFALSSVSDPTVSTLYL